MQESPQPFKEKTLGEKMHDLAKELFPICRSITGEGFRQSLKLLDNAMGGGSYKFILSQAGPAFLTGLFHLNGA